jgi:hypothetical protein
MSNGHGNGQDGGNGQGGSNGQAGPSLRERIATLTRELGITDPNIGNAFETDLDAVPVGPTSPRPNRLTAIVPADHAEMNLGQAFTGRAQLDDPGICFRTDTHIDFRTVDGQKTTVTMGGPATKGEKTWDGDNLPHATVGYGMGTESAAYRVAKHRVYVLTKAGDLIVRAANDKSAVLQSKGGHTLVNAGADVAITSGDTVLIGAGPCQLPSPVWNGLWQPDTTAATLSACSTTAGAMAAAAASAQATLAGQHMHVNVPNAGKPGTTAKHTLLPTFQKIAAVLGGLCHTTWAAGNNVRMHGLAIVHAAGHANAGMWGNVSANVIGGLIGVAMGFSADLKGAVHAGVYAGVEACVGSLGRVFVKTVTGDITCYGDHEVAIASNKCTSIHSQNSSAQLNGDHEAFAYGKATAYVLSKSHGLRCSPNFVTLAMIDTGNKLFDHAEKKTFITINDNWFEAQREENARRLRLDKNKVAHFQYDNSTAVDVSTSRVLWQGKIHQLGG